MSGEELIAALFSLRDEKYGDFQSGIIPGMDRERIIGVRTPRLRRLAGQAERPVPPFGYFEEEQIAAFQISAIEDFDECVTAVCAFLPHVDNWASCDQLAPRVFSKHKGELLPYIYGWLEARETFTVRFGIRMLMDHFLDEDYDPAYPARVAALPASPYYVSMMVAWYFATALAKQYDRVIAYIEEGRLDRVTHNRVISKAADSRRISAEKKAYLRTLRRNKDE